MSYKIRKENRICADWILSVLCANPLEEVDPLREDCFRYKFDTYTTRQLLGMEDYTMELLNAAIRLLIANTHIEVNTASADFPHKSLNATIQGQDAFDGSYYLRENKKDRLESVELYTKWIIPIIGAGTSLVALALSIYNLIHQKDS